jgi:hypothetical protein
MKSKSATILLITIATAASGPVRAGIILDADFFSGIPHTLVEFEKDGSGNPVILTNGDSRPMPSDEYAAFGFTFDPVIEWVNDASDAFDAAQAIGGSPEISIPSATKDDYFINFSVPVRAFGFWVINNSWVGVIPVFEAYGASGLVETVRFEGDAIDGNIGRADYGFLGIVADEDITGIHTTKEATIFDNFMFSSIPEPATLLLLFLGAVMMRRKQKQFFEGSKK